jgi:large repetitive protein
MAPGRQEAGLTLQERINSTVTLTGDLQQTKDQSRTATDGAKRDAASVGISLKLSDSLKLDVTANSVKETQVSGSGGFLSATQAQQSSVPGLGWGSNTSFGFSSTGLLASPTSLTGLNPNAGTPALVSNQYTSLRARLTGRISDAASAYGEYEKSGDDRQRAALGGEYRINEKSRMYARHEFANSLSGTYGLTTDGSKTTNTVLGVDTAYMQDGQLFSEYRIAGSHSGQDVAGALGVRNLWRVGEGFNVTTSLERQAIVPAVTARQDATAISLGADYTANALYKTGGKLEYRTSGVQNAWLSTLAYDRKLSNSWTALARNLYMTQRARGDGIALGNGTQAQDHMQLGLAYRDVEENIWHGLSRLDFKTERSDAISNPISARTWIASLHGNYKPSRAWTYSGQVAYKGVNERFASPTGLTNTNGTTIAQLGNASTWNGVLLSGRAIWDVTERYDLSVYGSLQTAQGTNLYGLGAELGYRVLDNLWFSSGYTGGHYSDADSFSSNKSWNAWHMRLRFKFDEKILPN